MAELTYLAGPMSGYPENNYPLFIEITKQLRERGYEIVSPVEQVDHSKGEPSWNDCMKADLRAMLTCDRVFLLPKWQDSKGATLEVFLATLVGMKLYALQLAPSGYPSIWQYNCTTFQAIRLLIRMHFPLLAKALAKMDSSVVSS